MRCSECGGKTIVRQSFSFPGFVKRTRLCTKCGRKINTTEVADGYLRRKGIDHECT